MAQGHATEQTRRLYLPTTPRRQLRGRRAR